MNTWSGQSYRQGHVINTWSGQSYVIHKDTLSALGQDNLTLHTRTRYQHLVRTTVHTRTRYINTWSRQHYTEGHIINTWSGQPYKQGHAIKTWSGQPHTQGQVMNTWSGQLYIQGHFINTWPRHLYRQECSAGERQITTNTNKRSDTITIKLNLKKGVGGGVGGGRTRFLSENWCTVDLVRVDISATRIYQNHCESVWPSGKVPGW